MSALTLFTPACGLMDTYVQWDDIEEDMRTALGTTAVFGSDQTIREIGAQKGFLSRVCVVEPKWIGSKPGEKLPEQFVAKISTGLALIAPGDQNVNKKRIKEDPTREKRLRGLEDLLRKAHNREVYTYTLLNSGDARRNSVAKIYATRAFSDENPLKGYILMEFFDPVETVQSYQNLTPDTLHQPLRALASLAAASLNFTDAQKAKFSFEPIKDIYGAGSLQNDENHRRIVAALLAVEGGGELEELIDRFEKEFREVFDVEYYDGMGDRLGMNPVLCHGDTWSTNLIWRKEGEDYKLQAIIDFQLSHFGNPAFDLARLLNSSLSGKDRRENWENLLETYYSYLEQELGAEPMPSTLQQLKDSYQMWTPLTGYMIIHTIATFYKTDFKPDDEQERQKVFHDVTEKIQCLLEDMLESKAAMKAK